MSRIFAGLLLTVLGGCTAMAAKVTSSPAEPISDASPPQESDSQEFDRVTIDQALERLERLSPSQRARLTKSMRVLAVNCPYTRASLQLPIALSEVVSRIDAAQIDPPMQDAWRELERGLKVHVAVLDVMGVDLGLPSPGDHLYTMADPRGGVDRATLTASSDPIGDTVRLIDQNDALVAAFDDGTRDLIAQQVDAAYPLMGPTSMSDQVGGWQHSLVRIAPFASDEVKGGIEQMIAALDQHASQGC